jgi:hypothetical protein
MSVYFKKKKDRTLVTGSLPCLHGPIDHPGGGSGNIEGRSWQ